MKLRACPIAAGPGNSLVDQGDIGAIRDTTGMRMLQVRTVRRGHEESKPHRFRGNRTLGPASRSLAPGLLGDAPVAQNKGGIPARLSRKIAIAAAMKGMRLPRPL